MSEIRHSPLPWVVGAMESGQTGVDSADGSQIFTWASHDDADIILRAVNSHYELVGALAEAMGWNWMEDGVPEDVIQRCESALAKARGNQ